MHLIISIPLNHSEHDIWYWKKDRMGCYSVKTSYVLIQKMKNGHITNASSRFWKRLWMLKVPSKVKHFMWRAATGCLPTKFWLHQKHVDINVSCHLCNQDPETIDHVLLKCLFSRDCWSYLGASNANSNSFSECLSSTYDRWDSKFEAESSHALLGYLEV